MVGVPGEAHLAGERLERVVVTEQVAARSAEGGSDPPADIPDSRHQVVLDVSPQLISNSRLDGTTDPVRRRRIRIHIEADDMLVRHVHRVVDRQRLAGDLLQDRAGRACKPTAQGHGDASEVLTQLRTAVARVWVEVVGPRARVSPVGRAAEPHRAVVQGERPVASQVPVKGIVARRQSQPQRWMAATTRAPAEATRTMAC